jgi:hypothetical protein
LKRTIRYWPIVILLLLTLLFYHRLAFSGLILGRGDTFAYFYPYWSARAAALAQGHLPLWSPDIFLGVPLLANPQLGTFYPLNWLPLAAPTAVGIHILLHVFWGLWGAYRLARRMTLDVLPALTAAVVFGLGGYVSAHVEQINQLQGLAWLPWLLLLYHQALSRPRRYVPLLAAALALQFFTGHTQTVFTSVVALGLFSLSALPSIRRLARALLRLGLAGALAALLAIPQVIPTLELISLSNRSGGLTVNAATSFSFNPLVAGRGLLPSYDGLLFGEFVAYVGVAGLGLALIGAFTAPRRQRWLWLGLALVGLLLALGEFNPLYPLLLRLPGFSLFRVPARWLALFALGMALLAGLGLQHLRGLARRYYLMIGAVVGGLAVSSLLTARVPDAVIGPANPTPVTWLAWGGALLIFLLLVRRPAGRVLPVLVTVELLLASQIMPANVLVPPETYAAQRFTTSQLRALADDQQPPGRLLSISELVFDPGDKAALENRYAQLGLSELAVRISLVDTKLQEVVAPNLPLTWGIPSVDGFDGGLLPTRYYTAFSQLLLPPDSDPTTDGRLWEVLARPECRGACLPEQRWLNLTNTRYLITDKVYDLWHADVAYDTQMAVNLAAGESIDVANPIAFTANAVDVLYAGTPAPQVSAGGEVLTTGTGNPLDVFQLVRYQAAAAQMFDSIQITAAADTVVQAVTLVDTRTGDFIPLTLGPWQRILSSDIKLYENQAVLPRAFVVHDVVLAADSDEGTTAGADGDGGPGF